MARAQSLNAAQKYMGGPVNGWLLGGTYSASHVNTAKVFYNVPNGSL